MIIPQIPGLGQCNTTKQGMVLLEERLSEFSQVLATHRTPPKSPNSSTMNFLPLPLKLLFVVAVFVVKSANFLNLFASHFVPLGVSPFQQQSL